MYAYISIYLYIHTYMYIYIYIYIHTFASMNHRVVQPVISTVYVSESRLKQTNNYMFQTHNN